MNSFDNLSWPGFSFVIGATLFHSDFPFVSFFEFDLIEFFSFLLLILLSPLFAPFSTISIPWHTVCQTVMPDGPPTTLQSPSALSERLALFPFEFVFTSQISFMFLCVAVLGKTTTYLFLSYFVSVSVFPFFLFLISNFFYVFMCCCFRIYKRPSFGIWFTGSD